jgi:hypothetical protein
MPLLQA